MPLADRDAEETVRQQLKARGVMMRRTGPYDLSDCLHVTIGLNDSDSAAADAPAT